jgi:hypothetical protein
LENIGVDGAIILKRISNKCVGKVWSWFIWIKIRTVGGSLWMWWWTFGFHEMRGISWLAEDLLASQGGLCCMEFQWCVILQYLWQYLLLLSCVDTGHCWCDPTLAQTLPRETPFIMQVQRLYCWGRYGFSIRINSVPVHKLCLRADGLSKHQLKVDNRG